MSVDSIAAVPERPVTLSFSGQATVGRARVLERSDRWRRTMAARELLIWLLLPIAALVPPHIPWVLLVLGLGAFRAFNRLRERGTLLSLHGVCPKCGTEQDFTEVGRIKYPHTVTCASCRWDLHVDFGPVAKDRVATEEDRSKRRMSSSDGRPSDLKDL